MPAPWAILRVTCGFVSLLGVVPACLAQAFVPEKGTGDVSIAYQNVYTRDHLDGNGTRVRAGGIRLIRLVHAVDFGVTDKLAISVSLPIAAGKYSGPAPHQLPIDNGAYHGALQDFGIIIRYQAISRPLLLTPFFRFTFPTQGYEHFAHSAIGSHLREFQFGVSAGKRLESFLPKAYVQGRYGFVVSERIEGVRPLRSRMDAEFGYFLSRRLAVRAITQAQISHNGTNWPFDFPDRSPTNVRWRAHDQISRFNYVDVGGGVSYELNSSLALFASLTTTVAGANGHATRTGLSVGVSWTFRTPLARPRS